MSSEPFNPETVSDEVLSAYLDGELSAAQATKVERWLANTPAARMRLAEFRRISGWMQSLPRGELPPEFASQVLQEAERRMLFPAATPGPVSWRRFRWWTLSVIAPVAATAALLILSFQLLIPKPAPEPALAARHNAPLAPEASRIEDATVRKEAADAGLPALAVSASSPTLNYEGAPRDGSPASVKVVEVPSPVVVAGESTESSAVDEIEALSTDVLSPAQVGTLLARIHEINERGQMAVIRLLVLDRLQGMEFVQVVLDGQQIPRDQAAGIAANKEPGENKSGNSPAAPTVAEPDDAKSISQSEALFVVADSEKFGAFLEALRMRQDRVAHWKLVEPIDLARLDRRSQRRVEETLVAINSRPAEKAAPESKPPDAVANAGDAPTPASEKDRREPGSSSERGLAAVQPQKRDAGRSVSRSALGQQLVVNVADAPKDKLAGNSGGRAKTAESAGGETEGRSGLGKKQAARTSLVQVILVIEPQIPATQPAAAKPESDGGA